jgi:pimeloyl-ACP methyl ester carboxylesterase
MQGWRGADLLQEIKPETLVVWGDGDRTYPWQQTQLLWNAIPQARLAVVPNCAHAVHLEMAAVFNLIVANFLSR